MSSVSAINPTQNNALSKLASQRGTAGLSAPELKEEGIGQLVKSKVVNGLSNLMSKIKSVLSPSPESKPSEISQQPAETQHSAPAKPMEAATSSAPTEVSVPKPTSAPDKPVIGKIAIDHTETLKGLSQQLTCFTDLSGAQKTQLTTLFDRGVLSKDDPASKEFLSKLNSLFIGSDNDPQFINTMITSLAKGDLQSAQLVQGFSVGNAPSTSLSGHLDSVVTRFGTLGESLGTQKEGSTAISQSLRFLSKELASFVKMADGTSLNQLSSIRFDAPTVKTLLEGTSSKFNLSKDMVDIAFGQAMILQHTLDGGTGDINTALKDAGISKTADQITSLFDKGLSGTAKLNQMCKVVTSIAKALSSSKMQPMLTQQLTTKLDILGDQFRQKGLANLIGTTSTDKTLTAQFLGKSADSIDFGQAKMKRTKFLGITVMSGETRTKLSQIGNKDASLSATLHSMKPLASTLEGIQTQLNLATESAKADILKSAQSPLEKVGAAKKTANRDTQTISVLIRMAMVDVLEAHQWPEDATSSIQTGQLHTEIMARLDTYGLSDAGIKAKGGEGKSDLEVLVRAESLQFKGADSIKEWGKSLSIDKQTSKMMSEKETLETSQFVQGHTTTESMTVREIKSWVTDLDTHGKIAIDTSKGNVVKGGALSELTQEALLFGSSVDVEVGVNRSKALLIETTPTPTGSSYTVTMTKESAKSLGLSVEFLGGLISLTNTASASKTKGIQLQFHSKEALTLFFAGVMSKSVNMPSALADISQISFVNGKKVSVSTQLDIGVDLKEYLPENPLGDIVDTDKGGVGISLEASHSTEVTTTRNLLSSTVEKSTEKQFSLSGMKLENVIPSVSIKSTTSMTYTQNVLQSATITKEFKVEFGYESAFSKAVTQKGMSLLLASSATHVLKANPQLMADFTQAMRSLSKDDVVHVQYGLSDDHCFEVASMMDPSSPTHNPAKAKKMLADSTLYIPKSIIVLTSDRTEISKEKDVTDTKTLTKSKGVTSTVLKTEINLQ